MEQRAIRRSGRISLEIPIRVSGTDKAGWPFTEETRTLVLSQYGARIFLAHPVHVEQQVVVRHLKKEKEATARVAWQRGIMTGGHHCGIEFLDPDANFWEIDFTVHDMMDGVAASLLLECPRCHSLRVFDLDAYEEESFKRTDALPRPCRRCRDVVIWRLPSQ
jgi:hypothetical protein